MVKELGLKLAILFGFNVFAIQPNFITKNIALGLHNFVIGLFLKLLSMVEVISIYNHLFLEFYQ